MSVRPIVSVVPILGNLREAIRHSLELSNWTKYIPKGSDVSLKVNLGWDMFIPGSITSPFFLDALIKEIKPHVGKIYVVEADQVLEDIESAYRLSGTRKVCKQNNVTWVNMENSPSVLTNFPKNKVLKQILIPKILTETILISVPVIKTHAKTMITGSLKNQWGCLPKMRHEYHLVLDDAIADLNSALKPKFAVMDATIGLEGNGPKSGSPIVVDRVLASSDLVALDTVQAAMMGINPKNVKHLTKCQARGLGINDLKKIKVKGLDPIKNVIFFKRAKHNSVSLVENLLRKSALKRLFFNTIIFDVCLWGAKNYYRIWDYFHAARAWEKVLSHPFYGREWSKIYKLKNKS